MGNSARPRAWTAVPRSESPLRTAIDCPARRKHAKAATRASSPGSVRWFHGRGVITPLHFGRVAPFRHQAGFLLKCNARRQLLRKGGLIRRAADTKLFAAAGERLGFAALSCRAESALQPAATCGHRFACGSVTSASAGRWHRKSLRLARGEPSYVDARRRTASYLV